MAKWQSSVTRWRRALECAWEASFPSFWRSALSEHCTCHIAVMYNLTFTRLTFGILAEALRTLMATPILISSRAQVVVVPYGSVLVVPHRSVLALAIYIMTSIGRYRRYSYTFVPLVPFTSVPVVPYTSVPLVQSTSEQVVLYCTSVLLLE